MLSSVIMLHLLHYIAVAVIANIAFRIIGISKNSIERLQQKNVWLNKDFVEEKGGHF